MLILNGGDGLLDPGREGLRVREPKNTSERIQPLGPSATLHSLRGLRAWLGSPHLRGASAYEPLFRSNRGTRVSDDALHYQCALLCRRAGLVDAQQRPIYTIHQLRHTAATAFIERSPEHIVSRMLGHRDPRSTRRYTELTESHVRVVLAEHRER
ncbi:MAG: hypothetical protein KatS3mg057_1166 [Herpetosiphonaceae bacterium]|nr:MAG: hypothetical protein KatS3mg057_1166 [Herpetosiphonaceae bacterium]